MDKSVLYHIEPKSLEWYELIFTPGFITIALCLLIPLVVICFLIYYFILSDKRKNKKRDRQ